MTDSSRSPQRLSRRWLFGSLAGAAGMAVLAACGGAPAVPTTAPTTAAKPAEPAPSSAATKPAASAATAPTTPPSAASTVVAVAPTTAVAAAPKPGSFPYAPAPKTGKTRERMIIGIQGLPANMDPALELGNVGTRVYYSIFDTPLRRDFFDNNKLVPSLATAWKRTNDTTFEMTLREGVKFHNGDPMTAEDVKYTFDRMFKKDSQLIEARGYFSTFTSIEAPNPTTVRIQTAKPDPLLEQRLASWASWVVPKSYIERTGGDTEFGRQAVGTGPYKIVRFDPKTELVLEVPDTYWGEKPPVRQLTFRIIPENAARVTALLNNEVQIITNIPPDQMKTLQEASNVEVRDIPLANMHVLRYNANHPVLKSEKLRQALNLGIDRQLLVDTLWNGRALLTRGHQFEDYGPLYNPNRSYLPFDKAKAKALVAESGYKGEVITYRTQGDYYTNGMAAGQAIIAMWKEIGVNAEIKLVTAGDKTVPSEVMVANWSNSSVLADPDGCFWRTWGSETDSQKNYWTPDPAFNQLGNEARTLLDVKRRYDNYQKMYDIWEKEAPGTVLYVPVENYGVSKEVNWSPYPFYYMDLRAYNLSFK